MSSGGGSKTQTTVQKADPWVGQQPYLTDIMSQGQQNYEAGPASYYPYSTVAPLSPETLASQQMMLDAASPVAGVAGGAADAVNLATSGQLMYADSNPYLQSAAQGAIRPVVDNFVRNIRPAIGDAAIQGGAYGGARHGIAEGVATDALTRNIYDITSGMYSDAYGQGLQAMMQGVSLAPQTGQFLMQPANMVGQVGAAQDQYAQGLTDADRARWDFEQQRYWDNLQNYASLIYGAPLSPTTTIQAPGPQSNPFTGALGGAAAGAAMYSALGATGPAAPFLLAGGGLGALGSF